MSDARTPGPGRWYSELSRYQWWVLIVATLGWLFDSMDQRLFVLARSPAIRELVPDATEAEVANYAAWATSVFIVGWATGGVVFGLFGDRWGRTRTMMLTILIYSLFTGMSACAASWMDFAAYRFLCGVGIGGEYAAGVALVAEVMPSRARPYCLGLLQGLSALGHVAGSTLSYFVGPHAVFFGIAGWRWLFLAGVLPALLAVIVRLRLREPESWIAAQRKVDPLQLKGEPVSGQRDHDDFHKHLGSLREIFTDRQLRYHVVIGMMLGVSGQIGLWAIGYWTPELIRGSQQELRLAQHTTSEYEHAIRTNVAASRVNSGENYQEVNLHRRSDATAEIARRTADDDLVARGTILQDLAGMCGIYAFTLLTIRIGRRSAFAASYALAFVATIYVFSSLRTASDVYWMVPLLGFSISSVYGGFAIYFPELFPTRLRSTGTGLCYNAARYITAFGPLLLGRLVTVYARSGAILPLRNAAVSLASIYLLGIIASRFAPETNGKPLPQ